MKYEVVEFAGAWVVQRDGVEVARFAQQDDALADVAERLRDPQQKARRYSLTMRFQPRR